MKKLEIILDENISINTDEDLTISDVIKAMSMLGAVVKDSEKTNPGISYTDIMKIVDQLSSEIIGEVEKDEASDETEKTDKGSDEKGDK